MNASVRLLFSKFESAAPAGSLDLPERRPKNPFLWRGQFPPGLAASLLDSYAMPGDRVLDPFAGSGTVMLESARKGLPCTGSDISPAALEISRTYLFCNVDDRGRSECIDEARSLLAEAKGSANPAAPLGDDAYARIAGALRRCEGKPLTHGIIANALL